MNSQNIKVNTIFYLAVNVSFSQFVGKLGSSLCKRTVNFVSTTQQKHSSVNQMGQLLKDSLDCVYGGSMGFSLIHMARAVLHIESQFSLSSFDQFIEITQNLIIKNKTVSSNSRW